jgi:hypothetical protein
MAATPNPIPREPHVAPPARRERHLRLVHGPTPDPPVDSEERRIREARWLTALVAVATTTIIVLSIAGIMGAADAAWWPFLVGGLFVGVVAFGIVAFLEIW